MKISIHETGIDAQYVVTTSYDLTFSQLSKNLISNTKPVAQKSMKKETLSRKERKANKNSAGQQGKYEEKKERKRKANGKQRV